MWCTVSVEYRLGVFFHNSYSEMLKSHYSGFAWILFWCTGIMVSGHWGVGWKRHYCVHRFLYLQLFLKCSCLSAIFLYLQQLSRSSSSLQVGFCGTLL